MPVDQDKRNLDTINKDGTSEEPSDDTLFRKYKTVDKEVPVTNPFEKFFRWVQRKDKTDRKVIQEKVVEEEYTYGEIRKIVEYTQDKAALYNTSIAQTENTESPDEFFPQLFTAEESLEEVVEMNEKYSFVDNQGVDVEPLLKQLKNNKASLIGNFAERYYSLATEEAMEIENKDEKENYYIQCYRKLTPYFPEIPIPSIRYMNAQWMMRIPAEEIYEVS